MAGSAPELRLEKLRREVRSEGMDGVILVPGANLRYLTGVVSQLLERPFILCVPAEGDAHLVAPDFESGPYERLPVQMVIHRWNDGDGPTAAFESLARQLEMGGRRWGCEARVPFGYLRHLTKAAGPRLEDAEFMLQSLRKVKDSEELRYLKRASSILAKSYLKIPEVLEAGITELEVARALKEEVYANGGETCDFCLVQAGERAADPHSDSSARRVKAGEGLVVDAGCTFRGYNSDITRTFLVGRNERVEEVYSLVLEAQQAAIAAARPGALVGSVDAAARGLLERHGLGGYFVHRTGHGLGLEEHESPYIVPKGKESLRRSEAFTIEPGAYIPDRLGVRIEDDVVTTAGGCEVITDALPKELNWWR